jgi:hypothetical protein
MLSVMSDAPNANRRWFRITPGRLIAGLLLAECLLWLSDRLGWPAWHKGYAVLFSVAAIGIVLLGVLIWWIAALVFRQRFQFGLRSLLLMPVAVAVPLNWLAVELKAARQQRETLRKLNAVGGLVGYYSKPRELHWLMKLLYDVGGPAACNHHKRKIGKWPK